MSHAFSFSVSLSVILVCTLLTPGCLVEDTPDYEESPPLQPRLLLHLAQPQVTQILQLSDNSEQFKVPIHPADQGHYYRSMVYLDFGVEGQEWLDIVDTNEGQDSVDFNLISARIGSGCHQVTLLTTGLENMNVNEKLPFVFTDTAVTTWWIDKVSSSETSSTLMRDCPSIPHDGEP